MKPSPLPRVQPAGHLSGPSATDAFPLRLVCPSRDKAPRAFGSMWKVLHRAVWRNLLEG